jgi:hypothetical protein
MRFSIPQGGAEMSTTQGGTEMSPVYRDSAYWETYRILGFHLHVGD